MVLNVLEARDFRQPFYHRLSISFWTAHGRLLYEQHVNATTGRKDRNPTSALTARTAFARRRRTFD